MKIFKKMKKGFTLVELVVVIAVIAILAAVSVGAYFGVTESANRSKLEQEGKQVQTAIQTISLAGNEHSSLTSNGLEISNVGKFEAALEESLGKEVALTDELNKKDNSKPTIYFTDGTIQSALGDKVYKTFEYHLPEIGNKKAQVDVVTGKVNVIDSTAEKGEISDNDKISKEATLVVADYGTANNWQEAAKYPLINIDENLKMIVDEIGEGNSGKFYNGNQWRIYQSESPEITISGGYNIVLNEIKVTYSISNTGVLTYNGANVASDETINVTGNSVTFNVGNTGNATNGQVRITAVTVKYYINLVADEPETPIEPTPETVITTIPEALAAEIGAKVELTGTVTEIESPWSDVNSNISFNLTDSGDNTILVYRGTTKVVVGDIVTVKGEITEYQGTNQVAPGSTATINDHDSSYDATYIESIAEALVAEDGADVRLTGEVINIGQAYNSGYDNISVTISDGTNEIYVYRLTGNVTGHQIITVTGKMGTHDEVRQVVDGTFELIDTATCSNYQPATCNNPAYCEVCGATTGTATGHTEPNSDGKCDICGYNLEAVTFEFGDNVTGENIAHNDGSSVSSDKTYEQNGHELTLKDPTVVYDGANDLKGNSCIKLGTGSKVGSFNIEAPANVEAVIFNVAQYKNYTSIFEINGTSYTATKSSNIGEYESIEIDTTTNKSISLTTTTEGYRLMINSIQYVVDESGNEPETPVDPEPTPDPEEPGTTPKEPVTATVKISDYAYKNGWASDTQYTSLEIDDICTATASGGNNTGKYYTTGTNWRFYETETATLTIAAEEGYKLQSITITYTSDKNGKFVEAESGKQVIVDTESFVLNVEQSNDGKNGQARVTKISVTYIAK